MESLHVVEIEGWNKYAVASLQIYLISSSSLEQWVLVSVWDEKVYWGHVDLFFVTKLWVFEY